MYADKPLHMHNGARGEVKLILRDLNGRFLKETPWQQNLILNYGLLKMGDTSQRASSHYLGDSNTAPALAQTGLQGTLLSTGTSYLAAAQISANSGSPNYIISKIDGRRHSSGWSGTVREVCCSNYSNNTNIYNRVVVPDFPVTSDQIVDSYYKLSFVPTLTDVTGQVTIKSVLYDYTMRMCNINQAVSSPYPDTWSNWGLYTTSGNAGYDGLIGSITAQTPAGNQSSCSAYNHSPFVGGIDGRLTFSITQGNFDLAGGKGVRSIKAAIGIHTSVTGMQVQFENASDGTPIPKDGDHELWFDLRMSWANT